MRAFFLLCFVLAALGCSDPAPLEPIPPPVEKTAPKPIARDATGLPEDPALPLVRKHCLACHDVQPLLLVGGDEAFWREVTARMQKERQMWPLSPEDDKAVHRYLAKYFSTQRTSPRAPGPPPPDDGVDPRIHQARRALAALKTPLMKALAAGLREGPAQAVEACHAEAPAIAARASAAGVKVGRASDKLRNPANKPPDWARDVMFELKGTKPAQVVYRTMELDGGGLGYVEPIYVQPLCLKCHGEPEAGVAKVLDAKYPQDKARGYQVGEYRGIFWAEVPAKVPGAE
jgi:hypothetical protein